MSLLLIIISFVLCEIYMSVEQLKQGFSFSLTEDYRVTLISSSDLPEIIEMLNTPDVAEFLFYAPAPDEVYKAYFGPIIEDTQKAISDHVWSPSPNIIVRDNEGTFMGMAGIDAVHMHPGNFEMGFQLPVYAWRKGIATAACRFLTILAFEELQAHKVAADCYVRNVGSSKTLEKCGYRQEGLQKGYYKLDTGFDDRAIYGMTTEQFHQIYR